MQIMKISREKISIHDRSDLTIVREEYPQHAFFYINFNVWPEGNIYQAVKNLSSYIEHNGLEVLLGFAFGSENPVLDGLPDNLEDLIFLKHDVSRGCQFQLICTDSNKVRLIQNDEKCLVKAVDHFGSSLVFISNILPGESDDCYLQAYSSFKSLGKIIKDNRTSLNNLARTWLYIYNILDWYDDLNRARNDFYTEENIFNGFIPASTGIGMGNIHGKCLSISAFAISENEGNSLIRIVDSPMQCDATNYKSSFSRAVEISHKTSKRLIISGTASIDSKGKTIFKGNIKKQVEHTMEVVKSIMLNENYGWNNVVRAIAYFLDPQDEKHFYDYCLKNYIDNSFILTVGGTICRDDLLFEIELDAVKPLQHYDL